jgi:hypothetical protein
MLIKELLGFIRYKRKDDLSSAPGTLKEPEIVFLRESGFWMKNI